MSDEQIDEIVNAAPEFSIAEMVDFFSANGVSATCPCCNNTNWDVITSTKVADEHAFPSIRIDTTNSGNLMYSDYSVPVVVVTCTKCGFIRLHKRDIIVDWVSKNIRKQG